MNLPVIGITMVDPTGIGPEIIVKVLSHKSTFRFCRPLVLGDRNIMARAIKLLSTTLEINEIEKVAATVDFLFSAVDMTKEEIKKIWGENFLRVFKEVEKVAETNNI